MTNTIPHIPTLQAFSGLLQHGYNFIRGTCQTHQGKIFSMELMGEDILCFYGAEAAEVFYDPQRFERRQAMPGRVRKTLTGDGGVQTLDGAAHGRRKEMFMTLMSPERIRQLAMQVARQWTLAGACWQQMPAVVLHRQAREILFRAACTWAGIPLAEEEVVPRADDLYALVDAFAAIGHRHRRGRQARKRVETWMQGIVEQYREGGMTAHSVLHAVATFRDNDARWLDSRTAAVELINILRPIVAIANFVTFSAHALHLHPDCAERIQTGDAEYLDCFIHEVRRFYPFAPVVGARVKADFSWKEYTFPQGALVLLDLYGTNHDADRWHQPDRFEPERFYAWDGDPFDYIPHGGGSHLLGHRCAGEALTAEVLKASLQYLTRKITYRVPEQDLDIDLTRIPALPKSGFIMDQVTMAAPAASVMPALVGQSRFRSVL